MNTQLDNPHQLPLLDLLEPDDKQTGNKFRRRKLEKTLSQIRRLQEELNDALYSAKEGECPSIHSPTDAYNLLAPFLAHLQQEELWVLLLNTRNRVLKLCRIYRGSVNQSQVRIAEVFKQAIIEHATSIIIAHNHPSGDPSPSPEDVSITKEFVVAGKLLDIDVLDHLVLGNTSFVSMKEKGLGFS